MIFPVTFREAWGSVVFLVCSTTVMEEVKQEAWDGLCMLGGVGVWGQEAEKATQTMVFSAGLGPGCWVLSDPKSTSYILLWSIFHSTLIWGERQERQGSSGGKVLLPSALFQVTVLVFLQGLGGITNLIQTGTIPPRPSVLFYVKEFVMVPSWCNYKHLDI